MVRARSIRRAQDQELVVQPEQLPGQRQELVVAAADEHERRGRVGDHRRAEPGYALAGEQQAKQRVAQGRRVGEQLGAVDGVLDTLPRQPVEPVEGQAEALVPPPRLIFAHNFFQT